MTRKSLWKKNFFMKQISLYERKSATMRRKFYFGKPKKQYFRILSWDTPNSKTSKKPKKLKEPKKTLFQNFFLRHPKFQDLEKTKKKTTKTIFQNSFLRHPKFQDLWKIVFFLFFFVFCKTSGKLFFFVFFGFLQDLWKIVFVGFWRKYCRCSSTCICRDHFLWEFHWKITFYLGFGTLISIKHCKTQWFWCVLSGKSHPHEHPFCFFRYLAILDAKVQHIVICGHYDCGGISAAVRNVRRIFWGPCKWHEHVSKVNLCLWIFGWHCGIVMAGHSCLAWLKLKQCAKIISVVGFHDVLYPVLFIFLPMPFGCVCSLNSSTATQIRTRQKTPSAKTVRVEKCQDDHPSPLANWLRNIRDVCPEQNLEAECCMLVNQKHTIYNHFRKWPFQVVWRVFGRDSPWFRKKRYPHHLGIYVACVSPAMLTFTQETTRQPGYKVPYWGNTSRSIPSTAKRYETIWTMKLAGSYLTWYWMYWFLPSQFNDYGHVNLRCQWVHFSWQYLRCAWFAFLYLYVLKSITSSLNSLIMP